MASGSDIVPRPSPLKIVLPGNIAIPWSREITAQLLLYVVWANLVVMHFRAVFNRLPFFCNHIDEAMVFVFLVPVLLSLPAIINRFCLVDYLFYFLNVFYLLAGYAFFPENANFIDENILYCTFCVFTFYFIGRIVDIDHDFDALVLLSAICIIVQVYYHAFYAPQNNVISEAQREDNMWVAYQVTPHIALILWSMLEKFRIWKIALFVIGCVFILSCGSRGPLVCIGFFGIIYFFFYMQFKGAIYIKMFLISLATLLVVKLNDTLFFLARTFLDMKLSTRIIEKLVSGEIGNDSYRSSLRARIYEVLNRDGHFWGLGPFGTRNYDIIYPHLLPLDFFATYGYVTGTLLLVLLCFLLGYSIWITRGRRAQIFIVFLSSLSIVKLMLSNTFLLEPYFYMLLGFCITVVLGMSNSPKTVADGKE